MCYLEIIKQINCLNTTTPVQVCIYSCTIHFKHGCQSILVKRGLLNKLQDICGQLRPAAG